MDERDDDDAMIDEVDRHLNALMEHFETVQIVATRQKGDMTQCLTRGRGNVFARQASVREWLLRHDTWARMAAKRQGIEEDAEDDDDV